MRTLLLILLPFSLFAQVRLPRLVRDSMVLQRDIPLRLWGWAMPGEKISITFQGKRFHTLAGRDSMWKAQLPAYPAGGPYVMQINRVVLRDVLIGDVWVCSGQSNMVHQLRLHGERYAADIAEAHYPEIREFKAGDCWRTATPEYIGEFSAVAYFFARNIYRRHHVPVGLITAAVGGSPIEAWMSDEVVKKPAGVLQLHSKPVQFDTTDGHWRTITVPGYWEDQGVANLDGTVYYRREVAVPASMAGVAAKLCLGRIVDADVVYVNGQKVGATTYQYPQRRYVVPAGVLRARKNTVLVKVSNYAGKGGFVPDKPYYLAAGGDTIDMKGTWQYIVGEAGLVPAPFPTPTGLYALMIAPVIRYTVKGILWYQGESNVEHSQDYEMLLRKLIRDWRDKFQLGDIPFYYAQLPGFGDVRYLPSESRWAEIREAQRRVLSEPNRGMAVTIDLGEWNHIHPDRKKEVGDRLALLTEKVPANEITGVTKKDTVIVSFSHDVTTTDKKAPADFAIAGADKRYMWAQARIEGKCVVVWSAYVKSPVYVRYAWADNPDHPNLSDSAGIPVSPFEIQAQ